MKSRLIGCFGEPNHYSYECQSIREYYGDRIVGDEIRVFSLQPDNSLDIHQYFYMWNLGDDGRINFRPKDQSINKCSRTIFTINGLNLLLAELGLPKGSRIDFEQYQNKFISEHASFLYIRTSKFLCKG